MSLFFRAATRTDRHAPETRPRSPDGIASATAAPFGVGRLTRQFAAKFLVVCLTLTLAQLALEYQNVKRLLLDQVALTPWGGYAGYFADPDDHPWEVVHAPMFPMSADGALQLPD